MVTEIVGGWMYNSMALLADGWHMSSHALALGLSVLAYGAARRFAHDKRFAFGAWKIEGLEARVDGQGVVVLRDYRTYRQKAVGFYSQHETPTVLRFEPLPSVGSPRIAVANRQ